MQYNVAALLRSRTGTARAVDLEAPIELQDPDAEAVAPVAGRLRFMRDHAGVLVQGRLASRLRVACVRCLEPVEVGVSFELEEEFRPVVAIPGGPPAIRRDQWDSATLVDEQNVLDLAEVVRQGLLLAAPLHALCRPDCAGLCQLCGSDLNAGPCGCATGDRASDGAVAGQSMSRRQR